MARAVGFHRIWEGDPRPIKEARVAYRANRSYDNFFRFASALHSFRFLPWYARELQALLLGASYGVYEHLLAFMPGTPEKQRVLGVRCEMLCAYFDWLSRRAIPTLYEKRAERLFWHGISYAEAYRSVPEHAHTVYLLHLRMARLRLRKGEVRQAHLLVDDVADNIGSEGIADANQRARVYASLGLLYRMVGPRTAVRGFRWAWRACRVPGIGKMARLKAIAALLGNDL